MNNVMKSQIVEVLNRNLPTEKVISIYLELEQVIDHNLKMAELNGMHKAFDDTVKKLQERLKKMEDQNESKGTYIKTL